jgi:hypothetical protein
MLRNALVQEYGYLQGFCTLEKPLANYRAAFTQQRTLVRSQHRPLQETSTIQIERQDLAPIEASSDSLLFREASLGVVI